MRKVMESDVGTYFLVGGRVVFFIGMIHIMLRDLLTQKCVDKKRFLILDTPEHVDSENIKLKIGPRSLLYQLF
jgi:hypothetical protein